MDITNFDVSISSKSRDGGSLVRDILGELRYRIVRTMRRHGRKRPEIGLAAIDNHLLRDIGLNRLGIEEAALDSQNEATGR
ncbi:MAG: hypothetical protein HOM52_08010 [Rhodospirillaceae bacterium]|nr:hypothetical protein [Rhodospirillaceae bacterium]MBT4426412.1 hypothetical protein [Rhodospirillaceae bacterium]MBT5038441.1 hypothetical protein [Rhodospirillaceae bacterium]MBT5676468.1 hypothetical protein [Rhodospirillaceae bacterium]MBT5779232.1 hypothetical protein [Rhodospirillaceae bacterium]